MTDLNTFWTAIYISMLAAFTGYVLISRVPAILHTPLMSGSNFIHGIVLIGAMVALGDVQDDIASISFSGLRLVISTKFPVNNEFPIIFTPIPL